LSELIHAKLNKAVRTTDMRLAAESRRQSDFVTSGQLQPGLHRFFRIGFSIRLV